MLIGKHITKKFGGLTAIDSLDFHVEEGKIVGLIGPNGSGKTTLFNVISGFYRPEAGELTFKGKNLIGLKPHEIANMGIARTFQVVKPLEDLTVLENVIIGILYGGKERSVSKAARKANELLAFTGLAKKSKFLAAELTLADRKRLEVTRALSINPQLLLLDEVFAGLNETEIMSATSFIFKMHRELELTIFMIEHILKAIMETCDWVLVLDFGRKLAEGTPHQVAHDAQVIEAYLGAAYATSG
ncbi:MAG: ABC transporter ATP-binding protein [Dehalococcoidia bacterium]|nr:ABC transporter ATP-binding protein [Dehalococcoidia bacterium]